jgi:mercuric reductase
MKTRNNDKLNAGHIMEVAMAIRCRIGVSELAAMFHPYLTQAESIKLCGQGFTKDVSRLSCCSA